MSKLKPEYLIIVFIALFSFLFFHRTPDIRPLQILDKYHKKPYEQEWKSDLINVKGQAILPEVMAAYNSFKSTNDSVFSRSQWDSIRSVESNQILTFRLRIEPSENIRDTLYVHNSDLQYGFGRSPDQRTESINEFNFDLSNNIWINIDGEKVYPSICHTEQTFGMENGRDIWIGFKLSKDQLLTLANMDRFVLFYQLTEPLNSVAMLQWPLSVIKKCI